MTKPIAIGVCGFGRCGSSMVTEMLAAGGVPLATTTNLTSYEIDLDALPNLGPDDFAGRAVKLLDMLHQGFTIPTDGIDWRFIWIDRNAREQALSIYKFELATGIHEQTKHDHIRVSRQFAQLRQARAAAMGACSRLGPGHHSPVRADPRQPAEGRQGARQALARPRPARRCRGRPGPRPEVCPRPRERGRPHGPRRRRPGPGADLMWERLTQARMSGAR